jgi:hypothetical protein
MVGCAKIKASVAYQFFISYASEDATTAEQIRGLLESLGAKCWIAPDSISPGEPYTRAIPKAIRESGSVILLFSKSSDASEDVNNEITLARKYKKPVIPIRIENVEPDFLEYHLGVPQWIDYFGDRRSKGEIRIRKMVTDLCGSAGSSSAVRSQPQTPPATAANKRVVTAPEKRANTPAAISQTPAHSAPRAGQLDEIKAKADQGDAQAQFALGAIYKSGSGVGCDLNEALRWFQAAAKQGHIGAKHQIGLIYARHDLYTPKFIVKDPNARSEAVRWFREAAEHGYPAAQHDLGVMYALGSGVEKDEREALRWYLEAAQQGDADAQYSAAMMYAKGRGVEQDINEAVRWCSEAADRGNERARNALPGLEVQRRKG